MHCTQVFGAAGEGTSGAITIRILEHELELLHEAPAYLQVRLLETLMS